MEVRRSKVGWQTKMKLGSASLHRLVPKLRYILRWNREKWREVRERQKNSKTVLQNYTCRLYDSISWFSVSVAVALTLFLTFSRLPSLNCLLYPQEIRILVFFVFHLVEIEEYLRVGSSIPRISSVMLQRFFNVQSMP